MNNSDVITNQYWDMSDSSDSTSCNGPNNTNYAPDFTMHLQEFDQGKASMVSGASAGLPQVGNVLQLTHKPGLSKLFDSDRDFTDGTYCMRYYTRFERGFPEPLNHPDDDIKAGRWLDSGGAPKPEPTPFLQCIWGLSNSSAPFECSTAQNGATSNFYSAQFALGGRWQETGGHVGLDTCQEEWCRIEVCFDHNSRPAPDDDKLVFRARLTGVTSQTQAIYPAFVSDGSGPLARTGQENRPLAWSDPDWNYDNPDPGNACNGGGCKQWTSHFMVAVWPTANESLWIGPAHEIEGGASGAGEPTPPAPPLLLE
jgi:hypothetical protein